MANKKGKSRDRRDHRSASWEKAIYRVVLLIGLIGLIGGIRWLVLGRMPGPEGNPGNSPYESMINCDIQNGPCVRNLSKGKVTLDIRPKPVQAMRDLRFTVILDGLHPSGDPHIDLDMPAMTMGYNRVYLEPNGPDAYEGNGVIVRCPSGIPTWEATVVLPGVGEAEYFFDVVY